MSCGGAWRHDGHAPRRREVRALSRLRYVFMARAVTTRTTRVTYFKKLGPLREATLARCRLEFEERFGCPWTEDLERRYAAGRHALDDDVEAARLLLRLKEVCNEIDVFAEQVGRRADSRTPLLTKLLLDWALHNSECSPQIDPTIVRSKMATSRQRLVARIRSGQPQPFDRRIRRDAGPRDLAVLSILIGNFPSVNAADLECGITVAQAIDRETKSMRATQEAHASQRK